MCQALHRKHVWDSFSVCCRLAPRPKLQTENESKDFSVTNIKIYI